VADEVATAMPNSNGMGRPLRAAFLLIPTGGAGRAKELMLHQR